MGPAKLQFGVWPPMIIFSQSYYLYPVWTYTRIFWARENQDIHVSRACRRCGCNPFLQKILDVCLTSNVIPVKVCTLRRIGSRPEFWKAHFEKEFGSTVASHAARDPGVCWRKVWCLYISQLLDSDACLFIAAIFRDPEFGNGASSSDLSRVVLMLI